jgi:uncharacterized Zn finger protein (UPF0148 family)
VSNFDEEAERERLRKKYEQDSAKREETQRMSELLLQGATMTNSHCDTCGSPIFRYDGQEFCPNCQHEDNQEAESATETETTEDEATESASASASASSIDNGAVEADPSSDTPPAQSAETPARAEQQTRQQTQQQQAQQQAQRQPQSRNQPQPTPAQQQTDTTASAAETAVGGTRSEAAEALLESITHHARMATQTNDPHRAITHLEAASEAADAWEVFK